METLEILVAANLVAFIFGAGIVWQKVSDLANRLARVERRLNGQKKEER